MTRVSSIAVLGILFLSPACAATPRPAPLILPAVSVPHLRIKPERGPVRKVSLEDYVRGAIISEFDPPSGDGDTVGQMLEIQAVIARTYAVAHRARHGREGFDLCSTTHCQLYQPDRLKYSMWRSHVDRAARRTSGSVLWYQKGPARTLFHADCGGHTSEADSVWQGPSRPYLTAAKDDGPAASAHAAWRFDIEADVLRKAINVDVRTRVGRQLTDIRVIDRDAGGRAKRVSLLGSQPQVVRAEQLRSVMARTFGAKSLRSARFEVTRAGSRYSFVGRGYGHGVGLCQTGAYARLKAGALPQQVLSRYYPGTRLVVLP